jgi:methyl-accepting chemotaxis protein
VPSISDINIGSRLLLGFGLVLLGAAALLLLGLWRMSQLHAAADDIVNDKAASLAYATDMKEAGWALALTLRKLSTPADGDEAQRESRQLAALLDSYAAARAGMGRLLAGSAGQALLASADARQGAVFPLVERIRQHAASGNYFDAAALLKGDFSARHTGWMEALRELARHQQGVMHASHVASRRDYERAALGMLAIGAATLAAGVALAWFITRTITTPLRAACSIADAIAAGDLSQPAGPAARDEAGQLMAALQRMQTRLRSAVRQIQGGAAHIHAASADIAAGNADLSARTEAQASSLEQTGAAMQRLTDAMRRNGGHAGQAHRLVDAASAAAQQGGRAVLRVVATMDGIETGSRQIGEIIGVIDGIAFQTNILALNAAVEAARAGEHGRGFAVVASEVRELAQRSAAAARQISALVSGSVEQVSLGSRLVREAGQAMDLIMASVTEVAAIVRGIASASGAQQAGIEEVNRAMADIGDWTQQNAGLVEQAAAAAGGMREQARALNAVAGVFRLPAQGGRQDQAQRRDERQHAQP